MDELSKDSWRKPITYDGLDYEVFTTTSIDEYGKPIKTYEIVPIGEYQGR